MLVRINLPSTDDSARETHLRFVSKGPCPYGNGRFVLGLVREAEERGDGFVITVEVTDPSALEYLRIQDGREGRDRSLLSYMMIRSKGSARRPGHLPYQRVP